MDKDTDNHSCENASAKNDASPNPTNNKGSRVRAWIWWLCIAGLLLFLAQYVESFDHALVIPSLVIVLLAFVASARSFWIQYTNHHGKHLDAHIKSAGILMVGLIVCGWLFWHGESGPKQRPEPMLQFGIAESANNFVWLTNDFLLQTNLPTWNGKWGYSNNTPWLIIPLQTNQTQVTLNPLLSNTSGNDIKGVSIRLLFSKSAPIFPAAGGWRDITYDDQYQTELLFQVGVAHKGSGDMPGITFRYPLSTGQNGPVPAAAFTVVIDAEMQKQQVLGFWIALLPGLSTTNMSLCEWTTNVNNRWFFKVRK